MGNEKLNSLLINMFVAVSICLLNRKLKGVVFVAILFQQVSIRDHRQHLFKYSNISMFVRVGENDTCRMECSDWY